MSKFEDQVRDITIHGKAICVLGVVCCVVTSEVDNRFFSVEVLRDRVMVGEGCL